MSKTTRRDVLVGAAGFGIAVGCGHDGGNAPPAVPYRTVVATTGTRVSAPAILMDRPDLAAGILDPVVALGEELLWLVEIRLTRFWWRSRRTGRLLVATGYADEHDRRLVIGWDPNHPRHSIPALEHEVGHYHAWLARDPDWARAGHRTVWRESCVNCQEA